MFNLGLDCFLPFSAVNLGRTPSDWQTLGLKCILRNHFNGGQSQIYKPKNVTAGWPFTRSGGQKKFEQVLGENWLYYVVFNFSFLGNVG